MSLSATQRAFSDHLSHCLLTFYEHHYRASSLQIAILMAVGAAPGITQTELGEKLNVKQGTLSRAVGLLGSKGYRNVEAMNLLKWESDASDGRVKRLSLTKDGEKLVKKAVNYAPRS